MAHEASEQEAAGLEANAHGPATETRQAREHLLDAALALFAEYGFEATTTKLIAERAGVPNGLIYYYFGTKEKLLECLLTERTFLPDLEARVAAACADRNADPRLTLIEICTEFHASLLRNESLARILSHEADRRPVARNLMHQIVEQVLSLLKTFLDDAQQQGKLKPLDSETVAYALFSSILLGTRFRAFSEPRTSIERLVAALLGSTDS